MPANRWNSLPDQNPFKYPTSSTAASKPESPSRTSSRPARPPLNLMLYSPEWWAARDEYITALLPRGMTTRSRLAFDLAAFDATSDDPAHYDARRAFVAHVGPHFRF